MKKSHIGRRRGTSVAAAALSFALVAPLAQPVAFAQDEPAAVAGAEAPAEAKGKNQLVPNAVYTKGGWRDYGGYHGYAYINKDGRHDDLSSNNEPLKGNVIYLQYVTGKNEVSPVFYTLTDSEGKFSFDLTRGVTDRVHAPEFNLAGDSKFKVRVWGENPDPEKYSVVAAGDMKSGRYTTRLDRVQESWNFTVGPLGSRISNGRFVLEEKPNHVGWLAKPEDQWTRALDGETGEPTVDGQFVDYTRHGAIDGGTRIWWESNEGAGSLPSYYGYGSKKGDRAAGGVEIVASYLNDEVARQIDAWKDANPGYTAEQERANQERIITEYQKEHGEGSHIAETVVAPSKADGTFYLPFKGTYGQSRTRENQAAQISNKLEPGDFGTVAKDFMPDNGASRRAAFSDGLINQTKKRHVNTDYMYVYPRIEGRDVKMSSFPMNMFQNIKDLGSAGPSSNMGGVQFPLMSAQPIFDIPEYNSYDNKGRAGSKVTTKTAGLVPNADYAIRWFATDAEGNQEEIKDAMCIAKSDDKGVLPSCDFQAPEDLKETTVFTAAVVGVDPASKEPFEDWQIADSFTAVVPEPLPLGSKYDEYSADEVAPLFKDAPKNLVEGTAPKYSADKDKLPDGLDIDPETGKITGTPTKAGTTEVIVTREVEVMVDKYVGVTDEDGNPVYENPDEEDPSKLIQKTKKSPVAETQLEEVVTKIVVTDTPLDDGVVGEKYSQDVKPEGFDALPQGFELKKDSITVEGLPAGLEFTGGKITGTPTEEVEASEEKPNVTVTYTLVDRDGNETEHTDIVPLAVGVKTTVDESGKKPVDPTDEKQGTGVIVNNPDDDTKVTATDEDGKDVPAVINPETGEIEVTPGEDVDGPINVVVEDPDLPGGKKEIEVEVEGHKKGHDDNGSDKTPGNPSVNTTPETVIEGQPIKPFDTANDVPEGGKVEVENLPGGLKVNPETGEVTGTPDKLDWGKDEEERDVTVTVTITDKDGNKVAEDTKIITVQRDTDGDSDPDVTDEDDDNDGVSDKDEKDAGTDPKDPNSKPEGNTPAPSIETGEKTDEVPADNKPKTLDDKVKNPTDDMTGDVLDKDGNPIEDAKVEVDPNTGEIKVTVPEGTKPQDGKVVVKDKGGNKVGEIDIKITEPKDETSTVDPSVKPGDNTTVPADGGEHNVGTVENPTGDEEGKLVDKDGNEIPGSKVEIDEDGNVKVTVPEGTDPQDAKVVVTDKDGNPVGEIDVNIVDPESDAANNVPNYGDRKNVEAGKTEKSDPFEGKTDVPVKEATGKSSAGSDDWTFNTVPETGVVEATAPGYDKVEEKIDSELPNVDSSWDKFKEIFTPYVRPSVDVDFTYNDGSKNSATAGFDLVGKDGKSLLDPNGDFDGDGISNKDEIEKGSNPADEGDIPDTTAPEINPVAPGDKTISGKGDRPGEDIKVTLPNGKVIETTTDKDGNWKINVPSNVELKPGDKVTVTDGAGNNATAQVGIDTGKCVATSVGFGLPLIALLPIGLATQLEIPGLSDFAAQANAQIQNFNTQIQQQMGIFNPQVASQVDAINAKLGQYGTDLATVAGGLALIAAGILAGTIIYDNCTPGGGSSVKDLELKGSSGKTYAGSSKEEKAQPKK